MCEAPWRVCVVRVMTNPGFKVDQALSLHIIFSPGVYMGVCSDEIPTRQ
jgi:hypothetical protein